MYAINKTFRLTALSAALLAVFGAASANEEREALMTPESTFSVGVGNWSNDRYQQGSYDGMREGKAYGAIDADVVKLDRDTGTWWKLNARKLGIEGSQRVGAEWLRQGDIGVSLEYSEISRDNPYSFATKLQTAGGGAQQINGGPLRTIEPGTERNITALGFYKSLTPVIDFKLDFKNEEKTGWRNWGVRFNNASFALEPIDSTTRQLDAVLNYTTKALQLSGGYYGSWYRTDRDLVVMRGATGTVSPGAPDPGYFSLPLDNQAHQVYLNGGYNFTPDTRATFKLSYGRATQDERLPTYGLVSSFAGQPSSLDGRVDTKLVQLGLTSRPTKDLSLLASLRYQDVDDKTPAARFIQTGAVSCPANTCMNYMPVSNETLTGRLEASYRLAEGYRLTAGVDERRQDRSVSVVDGDGGADAQRVVPMRREVDETTWRVELKRSLSEILNGGISYVYSERRGSSWVRANSTYNTSNQGFVEFSNQINPLNIADRDRNKVRLSLDWAPLETLSLQFNIEAGRDRYDRDGRPFGLQKGSNRLYSLDGTYALNDTTQLHAWYSYDRSDARQLNGRARNGGGAAAHLDSDLEDVGNSFGLGVRGEFSERLNLGADLEWTRTTSRYDQSLIPLESGPLLPSNFSTDLSDIENRLLRLSAFAIYAFDQQSKVRVDLIHERWKTDDWTWQFADGGAFSYADGTTVTAKPKQTSNFVGVRYIYSFR